MRQIKPEFIDELHRLQQLPGGDSLNNLESTLNVTKPSVAIRINQRKGIVMPPGHDVVEWANQVGMRLRGERPRFTLDPALHQGLYYVQDPSSMIIHSIVSRLSDNKDPLVYIDACAAPGGKTTAAIDALPDHSLVIANEFDRKRVAILSENVTKWGYPSVVVTRGDTSRFARLGEVADIVATDVPCSGEGMMRKDDDARSQWSPSLVDKCSALQREIVANLWCALKPGGYLIYSTCTFNTSENEDNIRWIIKELGAAPIDLEINYPGISGAIDCNLPVKRFIPGRVDGEGLFVAVLQKPGESTLVNSDSANHHFKGYEEIKRGDTIVAVPKQWRKLIELAERKLDVVQCGVELSHLRGRDYIPSHAWVMSELFSADKLADSVEVDYPTAMAYLRGEAICIEAAKGIVAICYGGHPLGLVKNLGNRANNLYPESWRVLTSHIPDTPPSIIQPTRAG